jgi:catechol 2,3-dioxygenase-like lactoylglutathione lyase family enzyme
MLSLHHAHQFATDVEATIGFWTEGFGAEVVFDEEFAGARNVFLTIGSGRIHLYRPGG